MRVVVDGYNFFHAVGGSGAVEPEQAARELAVMLGPWARRRGHRLCVVMDGGPGGRQSVQGVEVLWAGGSADEAIVARARAGVVVVSDDRELVARCEARGAEAIGCWELAVAVWGGGAGEEEYHEWDGTTRKRGPSRRLPRRLRRKARVRARL